MPHSAFNIPQLIVLDSFAPNAEEIREKALAAGFEDAPYQNRIYRGTGSKYQPVELLPRIARCFGQPIIPELSVFRLADEKEVPDASVHSDNITAAYAGMLYLTPDENCKGGTALWKHKETGWHQMPNPEEMAAAGFTRERIVEEWKNPDAWELTGLAPLKFNRWVAYPAAAWHSRYPLRGWGTSENPASARLTYNLFFDFAHPSTVYPS